MNAEQYEAIVKAAREREGQTTPAPWTGTNPHKAYGIPRVNRIAQELPPDKEGIRQFKNIIIPDGWDDRDPMRLIIPNEADAALIAAAPDLQSALIAADDRIKALVAELARVKTPSISIRKRSDAPKNGFHFEVLASLPVQIGFGFADTYELANQEATEFVTKWLADRRGTGHD